MNFVENRLHKYYSVICHVRWMTVFLTTNVVMVTANGNLLLKQAITFYNVTSDGFWLFLEETHPSKMRI